MDDTDVLVVGGGLTGLSCALFLAHHGVRCTLVERHPGPLGHPRQRSLAPRTLELYRQTGLEPRIRAARVDFVSPAEYVAVRAETLASPHHVPVRQQGDPAEAASPCPGTPIDQDKVEAIVRDRARELGARIRFGTELLDFAERGGAVHARLGDGAVRARYLIAADGAQSRIRRGLGIPMEGPGDSFDMLTLMVDADLRPALAGRTVHMAYLERPGPKTYLMALDRSGRRWVFGTRDVPGDPDCAGLVRAAAGLPDAPVRLRPQIPGTSRTVLRFQVGSAVAAAFRAGRVFLAGDAAHLMPPTGGFGGATGVQDARDLAWKLALVVHGHAGEALLDTYQAERRPVAEFTMRQAVARSRSRFDGGAADAIVDRSTVMMGYSHHPGTGPVPPSALDGAPGTRAPHVPLPGNASTLDFYGRDFVLLAGPEGHAWAAAARALPLPITVRRLTADLAARHGIGPQGALLVRPDGFVAWRAPGPTGDLRAVLRTLLFTAPAGRPDSAQ